MCSVVSFPDERSIEWKDTPWSESSLLNCSESYLQRRK